MTTEAGLNRWQAPVINEDHKMGMASEGMSVTFISSETDEMLRTCSRLVVMRDRKVVGELSGEDLTQTKIMSTIAGGESKHE